MWFDGFRYVYYSMQNAGLYKMDIIANVTVLSVSLSDCFVSGNWPYIAGDANGNVYLSCGMSVWTITNSGIASKLFGAWPGPADGSFEVVKALGSNKIICVGTKLYIYFAEVLSGQGGTVRS